MDFKPPQTVNMPDRGAFSNAALSDFSDTGTRQAFRAALDKVAVELGRSYPLVIGGERITTDDLSDSVNPAHPSQIIGRFSKADHALVDRALSEASRAFEIWKRVPAKARAAVLFAAADRMRARRHEFSAWMVYETGKSWVEADADTAEAIDFLEYYGRWMIRLDEGGEVTPVPGEHPEMFYIPLGVGAVIPPWNFPCAILTGMTSAAIVAGNSVILKPASTSPGIAWQVAELLWEAGLPDGVLNYLPGPGSVMGDTLVDDPRTRFIAFTGSMEVGIRINERAAKVNPGQIWIKRAILEMGGKDAVVVDETADLEAAATGIAVSAFGYQGQKCSAGSRAIIVDAVYDEVVEKVLAKARQIVKMGDPVDPDTYLGPVIDEPAYRKILEYIDIGKGEGKLLMGGGAAGGLEGYFIEATIFGDVPRDARIAQEEIFGPVLACIRAADFDDALAIANGTIYGLTGSLYTRDAARAERAKQEFHVGNLYLNRKCTGALVGGHPFGGFNMSGTDSKAGGPDYLLLFTQPKSVSSIVAQ